MKIEFEYIKCPDHVTSTITIFFPLAICGGYWVTLTPNKLIFRHLIHLARGSCPGAGQHRSRVSRGFISVVTLNLSSACECGRDPPAISWQLPDENPSAGLSSAPPSRRIPREVTGPVSSSCPWPFSDQDPAQGRHPRTVTE